MSTPGQDANGRGRGPGRGTYRGRGSRGGGRGGRQARSNQDVKGLMDVMAKVTISPFPPSANRPRVSLVAMERFGNTGAVIIDNFLDDKGTVQTYSALRSFADVIGNKPDQAWLIEKEKRVEALTDLLELDDYSLQSPAGCLHWKQALKKYRRTPKLLGERINAQNYPFVSSNAKLMDLPGEIRNRIYRFSLITQPVIELAPKATVWRRSVPVANQHAAKRRVKLIPILRLLSLNKRINKEASEIFYGEHEFRFSNTMGWYMLTSFLDAIGPANVARLRRLAVSVPWKGVEDRNTSSEMHERTAWRTTIYGAVALPTKSIENMTFHQCVAKSMAQLKDVKLEILHMVILNAFSSNDSGNTVCKTVPRSLAKGYPVMLVHVSGAFFDPDTLEEEVALQLGLADENARANPCDAKALAAAMGWDYASALIDGKGGYDV